MMGWGLWLHDQDWDCFSLFSPLTVEIVWVLLSVGAGLGVIVFFLEWI